MDTKEKDPAPRKEPRTQEKDPAQRERTKRWGKGHSTMKNNFKKDL